MEHFRAERLTEDNYSHRTIAEYERALSRLEASLGDRRVAELTHREVAGVLHSFPTGSAPSAFSAIAATLRWLDKHGYPGLADLVPRRRPRKASRNRYLTDAEYRVLWSALHDPAITRRTWKRMLVALRFCTLVPLRRSELVSLAWHEVDVPGRRLFLHATKTGDRVVPLPAAACELLLQAPQGHHYVFPGQCGRGHIDARALARAFERICLAAGINAADTPKARRITLHSLRHSWASKAVRDGVPLELVRRVLGHSTAWMTVRYAHTCAEDLRASVDQVEQAITGSYQLGLPLTIQGGHR